MSSLKSTQNMRILTHLKTIGPLTPMEAMNDMQIYRLAARILDLKQAGYNIKTTMVEGADSRYASYSLVK